MLNNKIVMLLLAPVDTTLSTSTVRHYAQAHASFVPYHHASPK